MTEPPSDAWLSLDEAAARLGVSRLRLREAIAAGNLPAQRDNRGFWRVSLASGAPMIEGATLTAAQRLELLFDEIEEISATLDDRNADVTRLSALVARQQEAMERALRLAEPGGASVERLASLNERSHALLDQALVRLAARDQELTRMTGLMDRALNTVAGLEAEANRQRDVALKQRALLDRMFGIAQASLDLLAPRRRGGWFSGRRKT